MLTYPIEEEIIEILKFVAKSKKRIEILKLLETPKSPKMLSEKLGISLSNISNKLREFQKLGLIKCLNPEDRKGRLYVITEKGKKILEILLG